MIYTEKELEKALQNDEKVITIGGELADKIKRMKTQKKKSKSKFIIGGALLGALIAAPFTGGTSLVAAGITAAATTSAASVATGAAVGAAAAGLTIGPVTISLAELIVLCGTGIALAGIIRNYNVKFNNDGSVTLTRE